MFSLVPFGMNALDRGFWEEFFGDNFVPAKFGSFKTDITENEKEYVIEADLPGFSKEAIRLEMADNRLTISAKKDEVNEDNQDSYIRKERYMGEVSRSFIVDDVNEDQIKAEFKDGVLKVVLPKKEPVQNRVRRIDLN